MTGIVAGIGFRAILGGVAGKAVSGGRSALKWLGSLDLVHALLLAVCIMLAVDHVALIMAHRHTAKVEKQLSGANAALTTARANVVTLTAALAKQNAAVHALASKSAAQQKAGEQASQVAAGRANEAQATSDRLKQSSRWLKSAPVCEPSDTLKGQWK